MRSFIFNRTKTNVLGNRQDCVVDGREKLRAALRQSVLFFRHAPRAAERLLRRFERQGSAVYARAVLTAQAGERISRAKGSCGPHTCWHPAMVPHVSFSRS